MSAKFKLPQYPGFPPLERFFEELAFSGDSIREVCKTCGIDVFAFWRLRRKYPEIEDAYLTALEISGDVMHTQALRIAMDATPETQAADRLKVSTLQWAAGKKYKRVYGERPEMALQVNNHINIGELIAEKTKRFGKAAREALEHDEGASGTETPDDPLSLTYDA